MNLDVKKNVSSTLLDKIQLIKDQTDGIIKMIDEQKNIFVELIKEEEKIVRKLSVN